MFESLIGMLCMTPPRRDRSIAPFTPTSIPRGPTRILPEDHYFAYVSYENIPSYPDLKKLFPGGASEEWDVEKYELETHESCKNVDEKPCEREFWVCNSYRPMRHEKVIAAANKDGFRPVTLKEALAFAAAHPAVQWALWILVLGSYAVRQDGVRCVPHLSTNGGMRCLGYDGYDDEWNGDFRLLLVRK